MIQYSLYVLLSFQLLCLCSDKRKSYSTSIHGLSLLSPNKMKPPLPISQEIGTSPTLNYKFFDPLNLANEYNFASFREAELKHGRVAMLATLGNTLPDIFRDQITPPENVYISPSHGLHFRDVPCGLKALKVIPVGGWVQIILFIGFFETQVFIQRDKKDLPGEYFIRRYNNMIVEVLCLYYRNYCHFYKKLV